MKLPRILVVIASYGEKNRPYLEQIIYNYQALDAITTDIIVLSEAPKDLAPGVKVIVGLPAKNPWSLPFAHKQIFADRVDDYDLFIYTEDDIEITAENLRAFLGVTPLLASDELAGFFRFEIEETTGTRFYPDVHAFFRWKPDSVRTRGPYTVAEFTNEHAGCYALTRDQLHRALASGGFLRAPGDGLYGFPETAATDPYTSCGFRKVIPISAFTDFLVHHLPNRYLALGIGLEDRFFQPQLTALFAILDGDLPAKTLLESTTSRLWHRRWSKSYYEAPHPELAKHLPTEAQTILSIGCGAGATEKELIAKGKIVTALPLDSVIASVAELNEVDLIYGTLEEGLIQLQRSRFDCVLIANLLHLLPDPFEVLKWGVELLNPGGTLLLIGVNLDPLPLFLRQARHPAHYRGLENRTESGITLLPTGEIRRFLKTAGLNVAATHRFDYNRTTRRRRRGRWTMNNWIISAAATRSLLRPNELENTPPPPPAYFTPTN